MKYLLVALLLLTGCSTVPVVAKFPDAPKSGQGTCPQLDTVPDNVKLSELTKTTTKNYNTYYECAVKVDVWQEWYEIQKHIFEGVAK